MLTFIVNFEDCPMRGSAAPRPARLIGPVGLLLSGALLLVHDRGPALLVADLGLGLLIALALGTHLAFHRRWRRNGSTPGGEP
jgi:hypothetical protein